MVCQFKEYGGTGRRRGKGLFFNLILGVGGLIHDFVHVAQKPFNLLTIDRLDRSRSNQLLVII